MLALALGGALLPAQSLTVTAGAALTVYPGSQNVPLPVAAGASGTTGPITITATGLPAGVSVAPIQLDAGQSGDLMFSASVFADPDAFYYDNIADTKTVTIVAVAGDNQASTTTQLTVSISNPQFVPAPGDIDLPIVKIDTGGAAITSTTEDVPGTITITSADGATAYLSGASATFHVHGHSTAAFPKLSYKLKLAASLDLLHAMGLSCGYVTSGSQKPTCDKSKSYILLANYDDKTFLRDWAASALANAIPVGGEYLGEPAGSPTPSGTSQIVPWAPHSLFVELFLNGVYEGDYQLIEQVKVDSHRVNISELSADDSSDVTGGYLLEFDDRQDEVFTFVTPQTMKIGLKDPDSVPENTAQTSYIEQYVDQAENALFSSAFTDPTLGWRAYLDEASAVNFYIVNDVMGNVDGGDMFSSDYMYKEKDNPLLYMGPVWDFDISAGNVAYLPMYNPTTPWMQVHAWWYKRLFQDPGFRADVSRQFDALERNGVFSGWLASIRQEAATLEQSQKNNFGRWPMQEERVWPNPSVAGSFEAAVDDLIDWLQVRIAYLDSVLNGKQPTATTLNLSTTSAASGATVDLAARVSGGSDPSGTVTFLVNGLVGPSASLVAGAASVSTAQLPAGSDAITAVYSGDGQNALSQSSPEAVTVAPPPVETTTAMNVVPATVLPGASVTFTATVIAASGDSVPAGGVVFAAGGSQLGRGDLNAAGVATLVTALPQGVDAVTAQYAGGAGFAPSASSPVPVAVVVPTLSPSQLTFGPEGVGQKSSAQSVTVANPFSVSAPLGPIVIHGADAGDFSESTGCGATLAANSTCSIQVLFQPSSLGTLTAQLELGAGTGGEAVSLSGSGSDFSLSAGTESESGTGGAVTVPLTLASSAGDKQSIQLTCASNRPGLVCSLDPSSVALAGGTPAMSQLIVSSSPPGGSSAGIWFPDDAGGGSPRGGWPVFALAVWMLALALSGLLVQADWVGPRRVRKRAGNVWRMVLLAVLFTFATACGSTTSPGTRSETATASITVTATSSSGVVHTIQVGVRLP